jgi:phosphate transport system substrate-binding protein
VTATARWIACVLLPVSLAFFTCEGRETQPENKGRPAAGHEQAVQIIGSDTMVNLVQAWAEAFGPLHPEALISIRGGGSGTGLAALLNKSCDLAMSSRPISQKEIDEAEANGIHPREWRMGLDGLIVIVNPRNPVNSVDLDELRDIFLARTRDWSELGGNGGKIVILSRESSSGTYMFFKEHVLRRGSNKNKDEFSPEALLMPSSQAIVNEVAQNPHTVGYVGLGYLSPRLKALSIAKTPGTPPVAPSIKTVANNSYPISRPLFFYTDGEASGAVRGFIDFALSPAGQKIVVETDFVPVGEVEE